MIYLEREDHLHALSFTYNFLMSQKTENSVFYGQIKFYLFAF